MQQPRNMIRALQDNIGRAIVGKEEAIEFALIALLCKGHVLIEDVPGVGKTTLASALAKSLDCSFRRIQFTPDLMPSDVTGFTLVNFKTGQMEYKEGSVMSQVVLADEINRTSPKTQSSLLEVMQEHQVTVDGVTYPLPEPFMVLATQNPSELTGTYPLPEAQLDRFLLKISMGYPSREEEYAILSRHKQTAAGQGTRVEELSPVGGGQQLRQGALRLLQGAQQVLALDGLVEKAFCSDSLRLVDGVLVVQRGHHDDLCLRVLLQDDLRGLQAVNARHDNVHRHQIRLDLLIAFDCLLAVFTVCSHFKLGPLQQLADLQFHHAGIVYNHELLFHKEVPSFC